MQLNIELFKVIQKHILLIIALTSVIFISSQFVVMATVSTKGADIGDIRRQQEKIRLENEFLRSQINAAKTNDSIVGTLDSRFETKQVAAKVIAETTPTK